MIDLEHTNILVVDRAPNAFPNLVTPYTSSENIVDTVLRALEGKRKLLLAALERLSIPLDADLQLGIESATRKIIDQALMIGLALESDHFPDLFLVKRENLTSISELDPTFGSIKDLKTGGWLSSVRVIMVCDTSDDGYPLSRSSLLSAFYHELIHACIDKDVNAIKHNRTKRRLEYFQVRTGLHVLSTDDYGAFLNEMISHGLQVEFERELRALIVSLQVEDDYLWKLFKKKNGIDLETEVTILQVEIEKDDGSILSVLIDFDAFLLDLNGSMCGISSILRRQIYLELLGKVRESSGDSGVENLQRCMLRAKADPAQQLELSNIVDMAFGKGFYNRLKHTADDIDSATELLVEIQSGDHRRNL